MNEGEYEQHHIRYEELHGEDEIVMLSHEEHMKIHAEDHANGFKPIPEWIVKAAYSRSPVGKAKGRRYRETENGQAVFTAYALTEKSVEAKKNYQVSDAGEATRVKYARSEKGKAAQARYRAKQKEMRLMNEDEYQFTTRVEKYHGCGCPDRIIVAKNWHQADQMAGKCTHGNRYSTQHFPIE